MAIILTDEDRILRLEMIKLFRDAMDAYPNPFPENDKIAIAGSGVLYLAAHEGDITTPHPARTPADVDMMYYQEIPGKMPNIRKKLLHFMAEAAEAGNFDVKDSKGTKILKHSTLDDFHITISKTFTEQELTVMGINVPDLKQSIKHNDTVSKETKINKDGTITTSLSVDALDIGLSLMPPIKVGNDDSSILSDDMRVMMAAKPSRLIAAGGSNIKDLVDVYNIAEAKIGDRPAFVDLTDETDRQLLAVLTIVKIPEQNAENTDNLTNIIWSFEHKNDIDARLNQIPQLHPTEPNEFLTEEDIEYFADTLLTKENEVFDAIFPERENMDNKSTGYARIIHPPQVVKFFELIKEKGIIDTELLEKVYPKPFAKYPNLARDIMPHGEITQTPER